MATLANFTARCAVGVCAVFTILLSGCGLQTPLMTSPLRHGPTSAVAAQIVLHVKNELMCTAYALTEIDKGTGKDGKPLNNLPWLDRAVAKVTLSMTVEEKTALNPSLTDTKVRSNSVSAFGTGGNVTSGRSFSLGLGAGLSADASRIIKADYTFSFKDDLLVDAKSLGENCNPDTGAFLPRSSLAPKGLLIDGNLQLADTFVALLAPQQIGTQPGLIFSTKKSKSPDVLQSDVSFVVDASASADPAWKLVPVSYLSATTPLVTATRNFTDEVLVTIGDDSQATSTAHNIGKSNSASFAAGAR